MRSLGLVCSFAIFGVALAFAGANSKVPTTKQNQAEQGPAIERSPSLSTQLALRTPAPFIENRGQFDSRVRFKSTAGAQTIWVTPTSIVTDVLHPMVDEAAAKQTDTQDLLTNFAQPGLGLKPHTTPDRHAAPLRSFERLVVYEDLVAANPLASVQSGNMTPGTYNYFVGNDKSKWATNVRGFGTLTYRNVWSGIDLRILRKGADVEQEFVVNPGADVNRVQVAYRGIKSLELGSDGSLIIHTIFGDLRESKPRLYQEIAGKRVSVEGSFKLTSNTEYAFAVAPHASQYALVIDPTLLYSTFLGGSQGNSDFHFGEVAYGIAVDSSGNAFVTGYTESTDFPTTSGAFDTSVPGYIFITKLNPTGSALVYSTYLPDANPAFSPGAHPAIAVDTSGNAYVSGDGTTQLFPTTPNAYSALCGNNDPLFSSGFLTVLNPDGSSLVYSTCFAVDTSLAVASVASDSTGHAYLTGWVGTGSGIPTTPNAYQTSYSGNSPTLAFGMEFDTTASGTSSLLYSTYFGDPSSTHSGYGTQGQAIAIDASGSFYITGNTGDGLPVTLGAYQPTLATGIMCNGGEWTCPDAFVAKFNPSASGAQSLVYSTYLGGPGLDEAFGIAVDNSGNAYVTGYTESSAFPTTAGAFQTTGGGGGNVAVGFATKLNADGSSLVYSTYLEHLAGSQENGNDGVSIFGVAIDTLGDAYVTGSTISRFFPVTPDAFQSSSSNVSEWHAFLTKLNPSGSAPIYSTYLGGTGLDQAQSVAVDSKGDAYIAGLTSSANLPVTQGAFQTVMDGTGDAFITKFPLGGQFRVLQILPNVARTPGSITAMITGSGFQAGTTVKLSGSGPDIVGTSVSIGADSLYLTATFNLGGAATGLRDLVVTNSDGSVVTLPQAFTILTGGAGTKTSLASSLNPSLLLQPVTFTATVTPSSGAIPDSERVIFYDGASLVATGTTVNGVATFTTSSLSIKIHTIKATYVGDANFKTSSGTVKQVVSVYSTTTTFSANPDPSAFGQAVLLTAVVATTGPNVSTGKVTFKNGTTTLGTGTLDSTGTATLSTTKLLVLSDSLTGSYGGDSQNGKSTSSVWTQTVDPAQITMTLTSSPNPSRVGGAVKFTATLTSNGSLPNGQAVTFSYNGNTFGTATISGGKASFSYTSLPPGSDQVTATYAGSADYNSASASETQTVN